MTVSGAERLYLAVALDGAGWHPAAWRDQRPGPQSCSPRGTGSTWPEAERGLLDFVTIEDSLAFQSSPRRRPDDRTGPGPGPPRRRPRSRPGWRR